MMEKNYFIYFDIGNTLVDCTYYFKTTTKKFHLKEGDMEQVFNEYIEPVTTGQMEVRWTLNNFGNSAFKDTTFTMQRTTTSWSPGYPTTNQFRKCMN